MIYLIIPTISFISLILGITIGNSVTFHKLKKIHESVLKDIAYANATAAMVAIRDETIRSNFLAHQDFILNTIINNERSKHGTNAHS